MRPVHVTKEDLQAAISKTANWKAPGVDGTHNFWYKKLDKAHDKMAELFNEVVTSPTKMPRYSHSFSEEQRPFLKTSGWSLDWISVGFIACIGARRTETFSKDIRMEFGLDKCGIHSMHRGKWKKEPDYTLTRTNKNGTPQVIKNMEEDEAYKYLGMEQNRGINKSKVNGAK
ncbi:hypothetical protein QE152_g28329 [Popillia japonica]|uniref:Uncharacterized protein n=1 Tax=Popillia japonica TaxID=7064 RepID=A0AAW1JJF1_POPJA